jgi:hypothetical protein
MRGRQAACASGPGHQVPPAGLLPARTRRATPYLSDAEVTALMAAARATPT